MDRSVGEPRDRRIREIHSPPRKDTEIYSPGKTNIHTPSTPSHDE